MDYMDTIVHYFNAWLTKNNSVLSEIFSADVIYTECYGPLYQGVSQIQRWFADWNLRGTVLQWNIKNVLERGNTLCVEWYFCCEYDGVTDGFDGVSWIEFDETGKIVNLREFQSKSEHYYPYGRH